MPTMSSQIPHEVFGLAVFVNVLSFVAVFLGLLLCFMLWRHGEGFSYILLLGVSTTLGAVFGVVTHLDFTMHWRQIQIGRYEASQTPQYDQTAMFGKADSGWRSVFGWIAIYLYNVDSLLVLFWAITLFIGTWNIRLKSATKITMAVVLKTTAILLPAVMVSVLQIRALRGYPVLFLVIVNIIMTVSMIVGFVLVLAILYKYLTARSIFKRIFHRAGSTSGGLFGSGTVSSVDTTIRSGNGRTNTDKLLIVRFSLIMAILIAFETALIIYELVNFQRSRKKAQQPPTVSHGPDFSIQQAKVDLFQYIPGVVPSIVAWCIFGTTAAFRRDYISFIRTLCCCCCVPSRPANRFWWRRSYGRQNSLGMEAPLPQASFPEGGKPGITVEVNTEISLSAMPNSKPPPRNIRRVSFGGTALLPAKPSNSEHSVTSQLRRPISPIPLSPPRRPSRLPFYGVPSRVAGLSSPNSHTSHHSLATPARTASMSKAFPALPLQTPLPSHPTGNPSSPTDTSAPRSNNPLDSDPSQPSSSWLSVNPDSKPSSVYSSSEYAPTRSSTSELFPPPLAVRSPGQSTDW